MSSFRVTHQFWEKFTEGPPNDFDKYSCTYHIHCRYRFSLYIKHLTTFDLCPVLRKVYRMNQNDFDMLQIKSNHAYLTYISEAQIFVRFALSSYSLIQTKVHWVISKWHRHVQGQKHPYELCHAPKGNIFVRFTPWRAVESYGPLRIKLQPWDNLDMFNVKNTHMHTTITAKAQNFYHPFSSKMNHIRVMV